MKRILSAVLIIVTLMLSASAQPNNAIMLDLASLYDNSDGGEVLYITRDTTINGGDEVRHISLISISKGVYLTFGRGTYVIDRIEGSGYIRASVNAKITVTGENKPNDYIEIDIGEKQKETNIRYAECEGNRYEILDDGSIYGVIAGKNMVLSIIEKENADDTNAVKTEYYHINAGNHAYEKLPLDSFTANIDGVDVKLSEPVGIRFKTTVSMDAFSKIDELGYVVTLENYYDKNGRQLNLSQTDTVTSIVYDPQMRPIDTSIDDAKVFTAVVRGIPDFAYDERLVAKVYAKITVEGRSYVLYGEPVFLSIYGAAKSLDTSKLSDRHKNLALAVIAKTESGLSSKVEIVDGGKCGDQLNWALTNDGTLCIFGKGEMYDYLKYYTPAPWYKYRNEPYISEDKSEILNPDGTRYRDIEDYYTSNPNGYKINKIVIEEGVTYLGNWAFYRVCVDELVIPEGVKKTGHFCIRYSPTLKRVFLPESLEILGDLGISRNLVLEDVHISDGLLHIGFGAFQNNASLKTITIPDSVITMGEQQNPAYSGTVYQNLGVFEGCVSLSEATFGHVDCIPQRAFMSTSLESALIPHTVKRIEEYAFDKCTQLETVVFEEGSVCTDIGKFAFYGCSSLKSVTGALALENVGDNAFLETYNLGRFEFSDSNKSLPSNMFYRNTAITEAVIGYGMKKVPSGMFSFATALETIYISPSVSEIASSAFSGCCSLAEINFGGTALQWSGIVKHSSAFTNVDKENCVVVFSDGETMLLADCL